MPPPALLPASSRDRGGRRPPGGPAGPRLTWTRSRSPPPWSCGRSGRRALCLVCRWVFV